MKPLYNREHKILVYGKKGYVGYLGANPLQDGSGLYHVWNSDGFGNVNSVVATEEVALQLQLAAFRQGRYVKPEELGLDVEAYLL